MFEQLVDKTTRLSLRFKWITIALSFLFIIAGGIAWSQLNQELLPPIEFPQTVVFVQAPGLSPEEVRDTVTIPLEEAVQQVEGVVNIESTSGRGISVIIVRNEFGLDQEALREDLADAIAQVQLPEGVETPELLNFNFSDLPVVAASASSSELSRSELKALIQDEIVPQLEALDGVARVEVSGGQELPEEIFARDENTGESQEESAQSTAEPTPAPVDLPDLWVRAAQMQGVELKTTADLTPEIVASALEAAPQLLDELTPEIVEATPIEVLQAVPADLYDRIPAEARAALEARLAEATGGAETAPAEGETADATDEATAQTDESGETPAEQGETAQPVPLPESWVAAAQAQGMTLETTADLTPEIVAGIASFAPQLLADLTPEHLLAMSPEAVAALPQDFLASLDPDVQAQLAQKAQAAAPTEQDETAQPVPLPESWVAAAQAQGMTLETTADLTPEIVAGIASFAPQLLADLTPEHLLAMSPEAVAALPQDFLASLDPDMQAQLAQKAQAAAPAEQGEPGETLPLEWQAAGQAQGIELQRPEDLTPEIVQAVANFAPQLFETLTPDHLRRMSPEVLAWLPDTYTATLPDDVRAELDELAAPAGGLSTAWRAAQEAAEEMAKEAPPLSGAWVAPPEDGEPAQGPRFTTAADLINNGFAPTAADFLNLLAENGPPNAPQLLADLTPDVILWLAEHEENFLQNLSPAVLRMLSPEVLQALPEDFMASLDPALREELQALASGERQVFIPEDTIARVNGQPAVILTIYKDNEANTVEVSHLIFDKLDELDNEYSTLNFDIAFEQASFIEESISGVTREGVLGALFAIFVILVFLSGHGRDGRRIISWRSTLVTAVSIPLSVMMAFALMKWLPPVAHIVLDPLVTATRGVPLLGSLMHGVARLFPTNLTLNIMTLSGMTVAIGRVVDDSIVVLENIYRHIQRGEDQLEAVLVGTRDVAVAIFASTVTTVVVFLPIGLIGGLLGEFFLPFGVAVTYALMSSFVVAVTTIPVLTFMFIRKEHLPVESETALQRIYSRALHWALTHRAIVLITAFALFVASMWLFAHRPRTFVPEMGEPEISVVVDLPGEYQMVDTLELVETFEERIADLEGLGIVRSTVGSGGFESIMFGSGVDQTRASVQIGVEDTENADALTAKVRAIANEVFGEDNVRVSLGTASSGFGGFSLVLYGDPEVLADINDEVIATLESIDGLANVSSNLSTGETILRVDGQPAASFTGEIETDDALGVTEQAIEAVRAIVPEGVTVTEGFDSRQQKEGFQQAGQAVLISIIIVYLVMVVTFRSLLDPFTILFSLPLATIGAAVALWLTDRVLGMSALVGLMMLVGIVVTNAIVLIDRVRKNRFVRGMNVYEALMEGGRTRLRPILMTAIAAMLALVPLALGVEEGAIIAAELATVVIGGLFSSTFLTLVVVPVVYSTINRMKAEEVAKGGVGAPHPIPASPEQ